MKTFLRIILILSPIFAKAQITTQIIKAGFGVDAELRANFWNGFVTSGNDDWFNNGTAGTGTFVIDTTGAAALVANYISNPATRYNSYYRTMSKPTFTIYPPPSGRLWLDALWVRDYHAQDTTVFASGSSKNGMSPANWNCPPYQSVPDKNDILDMFMHIRRAGPNASDSLWFFGGISMDNTTGQRYFDFELYQTDIYYNRGDQKWYGYGPDEGHTSWLFDAAGNVTRPGDIIFTGEFQSSTLTNIEARIWVSRTAWTTVAPTAFNWGGLFDGASAGSNFGYANISPNTSGIFYTGLGSATNTWAGPFQLVLQDNSLVTTYVKDQFIEFSVNMTKLGLDPVGRLTSDICGTPFNRLVVKTRASASFTAELKDFVAPTDLFLAPRVEALADVPIFCDQTGVSTIQVQNPYPSSYYSWSTTDGHIVGTNLGSSITVDSAGTYIVTQRLSAGCNPYAYDTVTVAYDPNCTTLDNNLLSFKGAINNGITRLDWSVLQNKDVSYYDIERSFDGRFFDFVSHVTADPDKELSASYTAYDDLTHMPLQPAVFYRLKLKKTSGGTSYSKIIRIPYGFAITRVSVSPNPVRDMMQITINTADKDLMELYLYDMSGKVIRKINTDLQSGTNVVSIDNISNLQSGMYLVVVSTSKETFRQKIVLAK
ncbi:MAG TPA: T9SS type A sorting domain-containing protein [Chitinophagaceae bacterium]|jgi:hypothetical protein|nr:T9SS type A sorting domain-containing protein [Chitinophagaceae bacterium]